MIYYFFGLPGSGKTSHIVHTAHDINDRINNPRFLHNTKYSRVLSNVRFTMPPDVESHCYYFDNSDFGVYDMSNSLILFDESSMMFHNRDYAKLTRAARDFLMLHRHYNCDIYFYNQLYHGIDSNIRELTQGMFQVVKNPLTGKSTLKKIEYDIFIPNKPKKKQLQDLNYNEGQPKETYYRAGIISQTLSNLFDFKKFKLSKYYAYFDSFEAPKLRKKSFERMKNIDSY